jgi:hypothetical protein
MGNFMLNQCEIADRKPVPTRRGTSRPPSAIHYGKIGGKSMKHEITHEEFNRMVSPLYDRIHKKDLEIKELKRLLQHEIRTLRAEVGRLQLAEFEQWRKTYDDCLEQKGVK